MCLSGAYPPVRAGLHRRHFTIADHPFGFWSFGFWWCCGRKSTTAFTGRNCQRHGRCCARSFWLRAFWQWLWLSSFQPGCSFRLLPSGHSLRCARLWFFWLWPYRYGWGRRCNRPLAKIAHFSATPDLLLAISRRLHRARIIGPALGRVLGELVKFVRRIRLIAGE